jgi:hypothetical protein
LGRFVSYKELALLVENRLTDRHFGRHTKYEKSNDWVIAILIKQFVDEMSVGQMSVGQLAFDEMPVGQMSVGQLAFVEKTSSPDKSWQQEESK